MFVIQRVETETTRLQHGNVRYKVYVEERGWISADGTDGIHEFDDHDGQSVAFVAYDLYGDPAGTIRIIRSRPLPLPISQHPFELAPPEGRQSVEISRLCVLPQYRGDKLPMLGLCRAVYDEMLRQGDEDCYAQVEEPLFQGLRYVGFPFVQLADPRHHFGGDLLPIKVDISEVIDGVVERGLYAKLFKAPFDGTIDEGMVS